LRATREHHLAREEPRHESLVATEAVDKFVIVEESVCAPLVRVRTSVILVLEGVLPAVLGPLVAQEADEGRAPDEVGGGDSAEQAVEDGEALVVPRPPRRALVTIAAWAIQG